MPVHRRRHRDRARAEPGLDGRGVRAQVARDDPPVEVGPVLPEPAQCIRLRRAGRPIFQGVAISNVLISTDGVLHRPVDQVERLGVVAADAAELVERGALPAPGESLGVQTIRPIRPAVARAGCPQGVDPVTWL